MHEQRLLLWFWDVCALRGRHGCLHDADHGFPGYLLRGSMCLRQDWPGVLQQRHPLYRSGDRLRAHRHVVRAHMPDLRSLRGALLRGELVPEQRLLPVPVPQRLVRFVLQGDRRGVRRLDRRHVQHNHRR